jgi:hypothetical protein
MSSAAFYTGVSPKPNNPLQILTGIFAITKPVNRLFNVIFLEKNPICNQNL